MGCCFGCFRTEDEPNDVNEDDIVETKSSISLTTEFQSDVLVEAQQMSCLEKAVKPKDSDLVTKTTAEANGGSNTEKESSLQSKATTSVGQKETAEFHELPVETMSAGVVVKDEPMNNKAEGQVIIEAKNGGEEPIKNEAVDRQLSAGAEGTLFPPEVEANSIQSNSEVEKEEHGAKTHEALPVDAAEKSEDEARVCVAIETAVKEEVSFITIETAVEHETNESQLSCETRESSIVDVERSESELAVVDMSFLQPLVHQLSEAVHVGMIARVSEENFATVENNDDIIASDENDDHSEVERNDAC